MLIEYFHLSDKLPDYEGFEKKGTTKITGYYTNS